MLTAIRGDQIKAAQIHNGHIVGPTHDKFGQGIHHEKLYLDNSIVASFLHEDESVHQAVLDSRLIALWDVATSQSVSGTSIDVTSVVTSTAVTDTATMGGTEKGVLTTGTGAAGAGTTNYRVQIRDASSKDPVHDELGGQVYGELTNDSIGSGVGNYTLSFKKSDGADFTMAVAEVSSISAVADVLVENAATGTDTPTYTHSLNGKYFRISSPTEDFYVWYNVSGEAAIDPASENAGRTGIAVTVAPEATATAVATATASAINLNAAFSASSSLEVVTVTNAAAGIPLSSIADGVGGKETSFGLQVVTVGAPTLVDFMFAEVYSYLTAPYQAFITGVGFADVVGVAGSHNHHDLYYTKIELESGQLDNRYFTKTQLDAGQLDNRYYTESELDPNPGSDTGDAKLDTRYFKESEIQSTSAGSAGANLVGVTSTGNLSSSNVQNALVELQGDIDDIMAGNADINFSLDDAYDDGSIVSVDDTNVDWQLTDTKSFKVSSDAGVTDVLRVDAGATGDEVEVNGLLDVNGNTELTGSVNQGGGAVTFNAGAAVDIDGTNVTIDGNAASSLTTTGANLTVETKGSGNLVARAAGNFTLKDQYLGSALPLSQTGATGLSTNFDTATSVVGALNENANDLYTLINTTLPATTDGASGADQIGATGVTGVIPTGGVLGGDGTVQAMLEGIAKGAAGGKVFPTVGTQFDGTQTGDPTGPGSFLAEKADGMYFKQNEIVYIKDVNRFVMIKGSGVAEGTDWDYLWGANEPLAGSSFNVTSDAVTLDTTGTVNVQADAGLTLGENSGAQIRLTDTGLVDIDAAAGQVIAAYSDTEIEINGGALVDIRGTSIDALGALTATGAADDNMIIQTSGTGQVQLSAADEIDLTGGVIDINAGAGKTVTVDSDTSVAINGGGLVDVDAASVDIDATGDATIDGDNVLLTGATEVDLTAPTVDINGALDHDGDSFSSVVSGDFVAEATGTVDIDGSLVNIDSTGAVSIDAGAASNLSTSVGDVTIGAAGNAVINSGLAVDVNATNDVTIDAANIHQTAALDGDIHLHTTGNGIVHISTEENFDVDAPRTDFSGDVHVAANSDLYVDRINITSVDPTDYATITGTRGGNLNAVNLLQNSGFEEGSGSDATYWNEVSSDSARTDQEQFYNAYSMRYKNTAPAGAGQDVIASQTVAGGVTDGSDYRVSFYMKGINQAAVQAQLGSGTPVSVVASGLNPAGWTRYQAVITAGAGSEDLEIFVNNAGGEESNFVIDAVLLEPDTGSASDYFTSYYSNLVFTVGDEDDDQIIFRSEGAATRDLVRISQNDVFIDGNLTVTGGTTTVNTTDLLVEDNQIVLNHTVTGAPALDAFYTVERGDETDAQIKWNESTDKWELYNHETSSFETIVTSATGDVTVSLDAAYNGGSEVTVDNTNVTWTLDSAKQFVVADATDTSKFVISEGSGASSVKVDTAGGVDIDAVGGVTIDGATIITGDTQVVGAMNFDGAIDHDGASFNSTVSGDFGVSSATLTVAATGAADVDADTLDVDAATSVAVDSAAIAVTATGELDLAGDVVDVDGATTVNIDGAAINTTGLLTQTGNTQIIGDLDLDGNFDQSGNYTFLVDTAATVADAVRVNSAGGIDIDAASSVAIDATNINTTGVLTQTGNTQIVGDMNFDGSIDADGETINIAASGTAGTHLQLSSADAASITSTGLTLEAGTGAFTVEGDAASSLNVTGANLSLGTTTSGTVAISSAGAVTFDDSIQTNPIAFSQASADGFAVEFAYNAQTDFDWSVRDTGVNAVTSIMGALNANRQDIYEFVELLSTQGAVVGTAAGANLIGVDGITGVVPMDEGFNPTGAVGADSTLQEILNGLATSAGGGKTYANEAAFTTAKAAGVYFKANEHVRILDINRTIIVLTQTADTVEGFDWDYLYNSARPVGGEEYIINATSAISLTTADFDVSTTTADIVASGAILVDGESTVTVDAASDLVLTSGATLDMNAVTVDLDATTFDADLVGAFYVDAGAGSHINVTAGALDLSTQTSGDINITSVGNIVETAVTKEENVTTFDVNASGAFTVDGGAASFVRTTGANLTVQTVGSGEIVFKDAGMPASVPLSDANNRTLDKDPDEAAIASIFDAINRAYNNTGDTSKKTYYEAPALTSTDVANGYVQVSDEAGVNNFLSTGYSGYPEGAVTGDAIMDLPGGASNLSLSAAGLRGYGVYLAIYLNGLRLSDSEWVYIYDQATGRKVISFVNDHSAHPEFGWSTVNATDAIALSMQDHIVFDCTFQKSANV